MSDGSGVANTALLPRIQWSVKELEQSIQVSALLPFGVEESFVVGCGLHCRMFSDTSGLCPGQANKSHTPFPPLVTTENVSGLPNVPWGVKIS